MLPWSLGLVGLGWLCFCVCYCGCSVSQHLFHASHAMLLLRSLNISAVASLILSAVIWRLFNAERFGRWHGREEVLQGSRGRQADCCCQHPAASWHCSWHGFAGEARFGSSSEPADVSAPGQRCEVSLGTAVFSSSICCIGLVEHFVLSLNSMDMEI